MARHQLRLGPVQETLLLTLYARAQDSRLPHPILGDPRSAELVDRIGYDFARLKVSPSLIYPTALRARKLDEAVRTFVAGHPNAVVLDLGCGLDTRVFRCDPPAGVDWYNIDFPEVADLYTQLLPDRAHTGTVGAELTDPEAGWLDAVPADRPAMLVADGLLPFLPGDSFQVLIRALTGHLASGDLALNGYAHLAARSMRYHPAIKALGIKAAEGFDDPYEPERWDAGLTLVAEQFLSRDPEVAGFPQPLRGLTRLAAGSTWMSRQGARILRYRF